MGMQGAGSVTGKNDSLSVRGKRRGYVTLKRPKREAWVFFPGIERWRCAWIGAQLPGATCLEPEHEDLTDPIDGVVVYDSTSVR